MNNVVNLIKYGAGDSLVNRPVEWGADNELILMSGASQVARLVWPKSASEDTITISRDWINDAIGEGTRPQLLNLLIEGMGGFCEVCDITNEHLAKSN